MRWVVNVVPQWLGEVVDLFFRSLLGCEEDTSARNLLDG